MRKIDDGASIGEHLSKENNGPLRSSRGVRTAWHTHPLGQTLIVTAGLGRAQRWGGPIEEIRPVDWLEKVSGEQYEAR